MAEITQTGKLVCRSINDSFNSVKCYWKDLHFQDINDIMYITG